MRFFWKRKHQRIGASLFCLLIFVMPSAVWTLPIPGDINADGKIDILDIQSSINIAIGIGEYREVADVNDSSTVDVLDVQVLINTVLGVGGLVQSVTGTVNIGPDVLGNGLFKILALSSDGRVISQELPSAGQFHMLLPMGVNWCIAGLVMSEGNYTEFPIYFPVVSQDNLSLPLRGISIGNNLNIGTINISDRSEIHLPDLRHLLGTIAEKLPSTDENLNNLPDIYDSLFNIWKKYLGSNAYLQYLTSNDDLFQQFLRDVGNCANSSLDVILTPSLHRFETDGYPEMLLPIVDCIKNVCVAYLREAGIPYAENIVNTFLAQIAPSMQSSLVEWLNSLNVPEVTDMNGNKVPDFIEDSLCFTGSECEFDLNHNGVPDFIEDADEDGVPNFLDSDSRTESDSDGDGITNDLDIDANGNGILDYAENSSNG